MKGAASNLEQAERASWVTIVTYCLMAAAKLSGGYFFHSRALFADGMNNLSDSISAITMAVGLRYARRPADSDHPYGHWKGETIATLAMSFLIIFIGLEVILDSVRAFWKPVRHALDPTTVGVALLGTVAAIGLYRMNSRLAKNLNSQGLKAQAKDNFADALTSLATAATSLTSFLALPWLDGLMSLIIGGIILKTGLEIFLESVYLLTDGFPPEDLVKYATVAKKVPGVEAIGSVRARRYGANVALELTILVDPNLTVQASHAITEVVEEALMANFDVHAIAVHVEPSTRTPPN